MNRPTVRDVARHAGVSTSTVSRVLNDHPYVGMKTRRAVEAAALELGYRPNGPARSLRTKATMTVGLIVTGIRNEIFAAIGQGCERILSESDRTLLMGSSNNDADREIRVVRDFLQRDVDGLIMSLVDEQSEALRHELSKGRVPVVLLDREAPGVVADRVLTDHQIGTVEAIRDLKEHGHRRIALLAPSKSTRPGREVYRAFLAEVGDEGLCHSGPLTQEFGRWGVADLLERSRRPTGIIVAGTQVLVGALDEMRERGVRIPRDVSLVAYDDSAAARFHEPAISAVVRDTERLGELAAKLILERIGGRDQRKKLIVPTEYVRRGSVSGPSVRESS